MLFSTLKRLLLVAGAGTLGYATLIILDAHLTQYYKTVQFDRTLQLPVNLRADSVDSGSAIGKLTIPSAGISAIVLEGDDDSTLKVAPGHIPGTALPGEHGNVAIAGHRDTFFRHLERIRKGDTVELETVKGTYQYNVDAIEIVDPSRTEVLAPSEYPTVTLVTCYPFHWLGAAPKRFIVRGRLAGSENEKYPKERLAES